MESRTARVVASDEFFSYYIYQGWGGKTLAGEFDIFRDDTAIKEKQKEDQ